MSSFHGSSVHAAVTSIPENTLELSNDDIFQCVVAMSTLNLTAYDEIAISYIQYKNPLISHGGNKLTTPNASVIQSNSGSSKSQHKLNVEQTRSAESTTGLCSILIEAPPGKVLSILFLKQTCSRDNEVHVQDDYDGWSTTLDGCSPWKSPGYDVTTANRSAVVVIDLHNLVDFFRLTVHIKAVAMQMTDGFITRYVSHMAGYIQTSSWHPFARPFAGITHGTVTVVVPSNHVTLISAVYIYLECFDRTHISLYMVNKEQDKPQTAWWWSCTSDHRPGEVIRTDLTKFCIKFGEVNGGFLNGARVLFSFHKPLSAPERHPADLWNCSVPFWSDFRQHFVCNNKKECAGREDEMGCPDTSCEQGGRQLNERCYVFLRLPRKQNSWYHANTACRQQGYALATFPTVKTWYHFVLLIQEKVDLTDIVYTGLQTPDASFPHMYRYSLQWYNGSIQHFAVLLAFYPPPFCPHRCNGILHTRSCAHIAYQPAYALCQTVPSSVVSMSQQAIGNGKVWRGSRREIQTNVRNKYRTPFPFPSTSCPRRHLTQDFLACDGFSACWHDYDLRSGDDVMTDDAVQTVCTDVGMTLVKASFTCQNGARSAPYSLVCNHYQDCGDNSDEEFCVFPPCSAASQYRCANGQCLHYLQHCDEVTHCFDESDETDCQSRRYGSVMVLQWPPAVGDFDGRGWMIYTPLTTGRKNRTMVCPGTHVFCPGDGYCLPVYVRCNGLYDCPGREDENGCDSYTCPGLYRCRGLLNTCLHPDHLCDGWSQCPQHDDELFCNLTCPVNCICLGHAFTCTSDFYVELFSRLRYLDAGGTGIKPGRLASNMMLVYLSLANCDLTHLGNLALPNLLTLDLSDNRLSVVTIAELNIMKNLRNLTLARNPLSDFFSRNYFSDFLVHKDILHLDLSGVGLEVLDMPSYLPFPNLLSLNLSESGVTSLINDGFRSLISLRVLDLRGCPMTVFPRRVFKDLKKLHLVFTDNYKLCCEASLPEGFNLDNCQAPFNELSSCVALLRAGVYRVCLSVLAVLALSGNLGCFSLRIFSITGRNKTGFNVFVTHLCVSDFVMGVYMGMIGVADRLYLGTYLWEEDRWRHSAACQVAGVMALLSSEVSALIICLITLDRFLVIRFPFSLVRFSSFSAQVASLMAWAVGIVLVTIPFLPVTAYRHFYGQTGICVPLPITRSNFAGQHYAFGVIILFNLVVFIMIATGQISVYLSVTSNTMSSIDTTRKSRDYIVARRLITVVLSDFLCWFPVGLLGVLAALGVPISGEVNVAMAIFVLPLNSALNPFLYTLNMIQEKRRRATEVKLFKLIMDRGINDNENTNEEKGSRLSQ